MTTQYLIKWTPYESASTFTGFLVSVFNYIVPEIYIVETDISITEKEE